MKLFSPDSLKGECGLLLCLSGSCDALINGKLYKMERGFFCVVTPIVQVCTLSESEDYRSVAIMDDVSVFYVVVREVIDIVLRLRVMDSPCLMLSEEDIQEFEARYELIRKRHTEIACCTNEDETRLLRFSLRLIEQETMLGFIMRYSKINQVAAVPVSRNRGIAYKFVYNVNLQCGKTRSVGHYAAALGLSQSHFTRLIKGELGRTPSELIQTLTIAKAKLLLSKPEYSVKDVAAELNFPEQFTFRKYFKTHTGLSPTAYRERQSKREDGSEPLPSK